MSGPTRRELLGAAALGAAGLAAPPALARQLVSGRASIGRGRFLDGVASGEPSPTAVTFWSRLTTNNPRSGARLIVARDENLNRVVATRVVPTGRGVNGTLKARVGKLKPHTEYFYAWESGNDVSPVGRARTLPPPDSQQPLNIAFSSCQHYAIGYFSAHAHAAQQDLDLTIFLGDYIYAERRPSTAGDARIDRLDSNDLRSYRRKYQLYRTDEGLRELHRLQSSVHIWDDHEVENNYTDNRPAPTSAQRIAGYRAAFEWLPHTVFPDDRHRIYKKIAIGRHVDLFLLDERQYRAVDEFDKPVRLLGEPQARWLLNGLAKSRATWKIIANQVSIAPMDYGDGQRPDSWGGYDSSRTRILQEIESRAIPNVVFITGDAHVFMTNLISSNPDGFRSNPAYPASAVEYVGGSITSAGADRPEAEVRANNPWTQQYNGHDHGYGHLSVGPTELVTEFRRSDLTRADGATAPFERFHQPAGQAVVNRESLTPPV
jgi:phosphodiesterase/alkaline phosphatase D-like protein